MLRLPLWGKLSISGVAACGALAGGLAAAGAATSSAGHPVTGCVNANRTVSHVYTGGTAPSCPKGSWGFSVASSGQLDATNAQIAQNASDIKALQNVGKTASADLQAGSIPTGGGFVANSTEVGTLSLAPGTYQVDLYAKATPNKDTGTVQVFPQFFVYSQPKNASFTGDEFNVGAGALEPNGTNHDSYYSGSGVITVPSGGETLHIYAFGYDSDSGAATYALDSGTVTVVRLAG